jgi:hypothetical protein
MGVVLGPLQLNGTLCFYLNERCALYITTHSEALTTCIKYTTPYENSFIDLRLVLVLLLLLQSK